MNLTYPVRPMLRAATLFIGLWCAPSAFAQSTLFVIVSDQHPLEDLEALLPRVDIPVFVIDLDRVGQITEEIREPLLYIEKMTEMQLAASRMEIDRTIKREIAKRQDEVQDQYSRQVVGSEIMTRYGVSTLPAVIELDERGDYRLAQGVPSLESAIGAIEEQRYLRAPPALGKAGASKGSALQAIESVQAEPASTSPSTGGGALLRRKGGEEAGPAPVDADGGAAQGGSSLRTEPTRYSVMDAIVDGSSSASYNCIDLSISGVCIYVVVRVYVTLLGLSVEVSAEASLELTHSNPELLISSYKRLGASPIDEAKALLADLQLSVSGAAIDAVSKQGVPKDYDDPTRWAAASGERRAGDEARHAAPKSTTRYHEVEAIGHPGTILSYMREGDNDFVSQYADNLQQAPANIGDGVGTAAAGFAGSLQAAADESVGVSGNESAYQYEDAAGLVRTVEGSELLAIAEAQFDNGLLDAAADLLGAASTLAGYWDTWQTISNPSIAGIANEAGVSMGAFESGEEMAGMMDAVGGVMSAAEGLSIEGLGGGTDLYSFCPNPANFMAPYLASGFDLIQWKFNLPEMVYPQTYAPPLPFYADLYVGQVASLTTEGGEDGDSFEANGPNAWGSIYPRQGFVTQPDELKAAAVAAARAAHVVTRKDQLHVYSAIPDLESEDMPYLDVTPPPPYSPIDPVSGRFQMVAPQLDDACYVFGENDSSIRPWSQNRQSDDQAYVFAFWRQYSCCPEPEPGIAVYMTVVPVGKISDLDIQILE